MSRVIDDLERMRLLQQWAQMESSGIDTLRAMEILRGAAGTNSATAIGHALKLMRSSVSPATAWARAGLLREWQAVLLDAGFSSGRGERALRSLADDAGARAARWKKFKSKMVLPFAVLILAGFLAALPSLVAKEIGFIGFVFRVAFLPVALWMAIAGSIRLLDSARDNTVSHFIVNLPRIGSWLALQTRADFLATTAQALKAGIPALQAIPLAVSAIRPLVLARQYSPITDFIRAGMPMAEALQKGGALDGQGFALVHTGEHSGKLDEMLEKTANNLNREAQEHADQAITWLPRLIYVAIAGAMLIRILSFWAGYSPAT